MVWLWFGDGRNVIFLPGFLNRDYFCLVVVVTVLFQFSDRACACVRVRAYARILSTIKTVTPSRYL